MAVRKKQQHSLENKLFLLVLGFCLFSGVLTAAWIIHSEENRVIANAKQALVLVCSRYQNNLQAEIRRKTLAGLAANGVVLQAITQKDGVVASPVILEDEDGALRSTDGFSGAFLSNRNRLTPETQNLFARTGPLWREIAPILRDEFFNFYFISKENFIRIYPQDWACKIEADHDFSNDLFYSLATPEQNPSRGPVWTPVYYDSIWQKWMTSLIIPLYDQDRFLGITGSDFILDDIFDRISKMAEIEGRFSGFLFDDQGNLLVHPDHMKVLRKKQAGMNTLLSYREIDNRGLRKLISGVNSGAILYRTPFSFMDGIEASFGCVVPIEQLGWNLGVYVSRRVVTAGVQALRLKILAASLAFAVLFAVILRLGFHKLILQRIGVLGEAVSNMSAGDLDFDLQPGGSDEIGTLEHGFLLMRDSIKEKIASLHTEIRERIRAEQALRSSEERFRQLADMLPQTVFEVNLHGNVTYANQAGFAATGYTEEDFAKGINVAELVTPEDQGQMECDNAWFSKGNETHGAACALLKKDGGAFPCLVYARPIVQGGQVTGQRGIVIDMTEQKKAEEEKVQLETKLRQAQKMEAIGTLAGGIAHDFNNILFAILGYAEMIQWRVPDASQLKPDIEQIITAANRAKELVEQILAFSRQAEHNLVPVHIQRIIKEAVKLLRHSIPTTIAIREEIDQSCGAVLADPSQIHQIVLNLCTNATHAMEEKGGELTITLAPHIFTAQEVAGDLNLVSGRYVKLTVRDTGHGMDKETVDRIFDPFFTTKEVGKGTGLGLSVVHGIVQSHGGTLTVQSGIGAGTTFNLYFPVVGEEEAAVEEPGGNLPAGRERILLVDDEEAIATIGKRFLERLGYRVTMTTDSTAALALFRKGPSDFDLVITDQAMPNMAGAELARELLALRPDISIILCTGYSSVITEQKARELGIRRFCLKPMDRKKFAETVRDVLDGK